MQIENVGKPVVAVVDDDNSVLESLKDLLESDGYSALVFHSAKAFLDSNALPSVCCLISDVRMPSMSGWELEMHANHERPGLPIILITGHDETLRHTSSVELDGRTRVLFKKPFNGQELLAAVSAALAATPTPLPGG